MEVMLSQYQAVVLNRAIDIFSTRKIGTNTLIDDAYILQKRLAEWVAVNTPKTGNSSSVSAVTASATLAFNTVINDNRAVTVPVYSDVVGNDSAVGTDIVSREKSEGTAVNVSRESSNNTSTF